MIETSPEIWRLTIFLSALAVFIILEAFLPRKRRALPRKQRWMTNISLTLINTLVIRLMGPVAALSVAYWAQANGWGLFNAMSMPALAGLILCVILLDLAIFGQHVATHKIPLLWRLHKVHHSDRDIDVTSGFRFHPAEIVLSMLYKVCVVVALGAPPEAVILFEVILSLSSLFNHSNLALPLWLDRAVRLLIVTPDMHRVHHSVHPDETDSNYGFNLSIWDRLFRTYRYQPRDGHADMIIGLSDHQGTEPAKLGWSLSLPFRR